MICCTAGCGGGGGSGGAIGSGGGGGVGTGGGGGVTGFGGVGLGGVGVGGGFGAGAGAMIESFTGAGVVAGVSSCVDIAGSNRPSAPNSSNRPIPKATAKRRPSVSGFIQKSELIVPAMKATQ